MLNIYVVDIQNVLNISWICLNKTNPRDLIAATGLVILLKLNSNHTFFRPCDLGIWWMTSKNNRAPLLYYIMLCTSFHSHQWIKIGARVRKHSIWVNINDFFCRVWPWNLTDDLEKKTGHLFKAVSSCVHHFTAIIQFKLELQSENAQFGSKAAIFCPCDLEICRMTLKNHMAPRLCRLKLSASFQSHGWIQTGVTVRKCPTWVNIDDFLAMWPWNLTDAIEKQ